MRYIYSFLFYLILPFLFMRLLWRSRKAPEYRDRWLERLGFCPHSLNQCIWVHAVSVGETIAAIPFIKALKKRYPDLPVLVTNMTPTGAARVKAALGDSVVQAYIPYDVPDAVSRFIARIRPIICIIMETEMWPNLFVECRKREIPLMLANARLSEKSARGYQWIASMTRDMLAQVSIIAVQASSDAERFIQLGAAREKIRITGNLKFDLEIPADLIEKSKMLHSQLGEDKFIWIAASTHHGEEEIILAAHRLICEKINNALLILVPRHPERFSAVLELAKEHRFQTVSRSDKTICVAQAQVYLGDTMGELMLLYAVSDVAFVGGSLVSVGGHNMLEPAILGKPILTGPYLFNFSEISAMLFAVEGMIKVETANQLAQAVIAFFNEPSDCRRVGDNAREIVEKNRGALEKQLQLALSLF